MNEHTRNYVASMLMQLARMVPAQRRQLLAYLIEMAAIEARSDGPSLTNRREKIGPDI
ncbi:hypothetical protein [Xaviernesmea oryzae]|uniref:hypothetical protein n=1 Tax=Xaviernesmea oryzae TaxID=464029 RepID=UPI0008AD76FA|nr:hypothetical protein [Xaviernesmea oryzae]SEK23128.1 hypothetical protein SAMN04487976_101152 [Xaviernesmea oryzae]